jgi:two-component system chemotaxis response regulator CheY
MGVRKILIVDDDPFACDILRKFLAGKGYQAVVTYQSKNASAVYSHERPDVVLLDIRMPGKNGLETLQEIKAMDPGACVIIISAVRDSGVVKEAKYIGALEYLKKPVSPHRLEQLLVSIEHSIRKN